MSGEFEVPAPMHRRPGDQILKALEFDDRRIAAQAAGRSIVKSFAPLDPETLFTHDNIIADDGMICGPQVTGYLQEGEAEFVERKLNADK